VTLRILVANAEQDEDRSAKLVARALADAGHEVVYAGMGQSPEMIAATAVQEAVDTIAVGDANVVVAVIEALAAWGASDIAVKAFSEVA